MPLWNKFHRPIARWSLLVNCAAQVALALITYSYLRETRTLTRQSEQQLEHLKQVSALEHLPTLTMAVEDLNEKNYAEQVATDTKLSEEVRQATLKRIKEKPHLFTCRVKNVGQKPAESIRAFIYDSSAKSFVDAQTGFDVLSFDETFAAWADPPRYTAAQIIEHTNGFYNLSNVLKPEDLPLGDNSYLMVVFKDIAGEIYIRKRAFDINDDGTITHFASQMIW
jgi:hypothetical protein